jgi:adenosylcobinamide-GDP ribazoletransferase
MRGGGFRLAVTLLTVIPLPGRPPTEHSIRSNGGAAMMWSPVVGLALGGFAAGLLWVAARWIGPLPASVLAIAALAALTGGLHLDGLADLADGLGSRAPAAAALDIMRRSDIGPLGVVTLVLTLLIQVAALDAAQAAGRGPVAIVAAAVTARLSMAEACRRGVPAARPDGLGALVAGTVPPLAVAALAVAAIGAAAVVSWPAAAGVTAGLVAGSALAAIAVRRLGGITGDVLGAVAEVAAAACLLVTAVHW